MDSLKPVCSYTKMAAHETIITDIEEQLRPSAGNKIYFIALTVF